MSMEKEFTKMIREPREAREKIEREKRQEEWTAAVRACSSVVLVGKPIEITSGFKSVLEKEVRVLDLTTVPAEYEILKDAISGTFREMGRLLVFLLDSYVKADDNVINCAFDFAHQRGSSHVVCFRSSEHLLSFPRDFGTGRRQLVSGAGLVVIAEDKKEETFSRVMDGMYFGEERLLFSTSVVEITQRIAHKAHELFHAAMTV